MGRTGGSRTARERAARANDAGYRDLVQLAHPTGDRLRLGARGVLEGDGGRLCRLTRVAIGEPVEVGDLVFAADPAGLTDEAVNRDRASPHLLYGAWSAWSVRLQGRIGIFGSNRRSRPNVNRSLSR